MAAQPTNPEGAGVANPLEDELLEEELLDELLLDEELLEDELLLLPEGPPQALRADSISAPIIGTPKYPVVNLRIVVASNGFLGVGKCMFFSCTCRYIGALREYCQCQLVVSYEVI